MPLYRNKKIKENKNYTMMNHPGLAQLRHEVYVSTFFLVTVPAITYFSVFYGLSDYIHPYERLYAGLACTASIWLVIVIIIIVKYWDDFKAVYDGKGHIPYDETKIADLEYLRSEQYVKDERAREDREAKEQKKKQRRKKRKNENSVLKTFTNFDVGISSDEDELTKLELKNNPFKNAEEEKKEEEPIEWEYYTETDSEEEKKKEEVSESSDYSDTDDDDDDV